MMIVVKHTFPNNHEQHFLIEGEYSPADEQTADNPGSPESFDVMRILTRLRGQSGEFERVDVTMLIEAISEDVYRDLGEVALAKLKEQS